MLKVMAIVRSLFLVGIASYLLWAMPLAILMSGAATRDAACFKVADIGRLSLAAWIAIGWIALETAVGWLRVWLEGRRQLRQAPAVAGASGASPGPAA